MLVTCARRRRGNPYAARGHGGGACACGQEQDRERLRAQRSLREAVSTDGVRSSFKGWARQHDVDELLSEFALAHVEGSATVAAYARDDLLEKRRRSCRHGPIASRGRGGFRTRHGPLIDSCGVRRLATMRRAARRNACGAPWRRRTARPPTGEARRAPRCRPGP